MVDDKIENRGEQGGIIPAGFDAAQYQTGGTENFKPTDVAAELPATKDLFANFYKTALLQDPNAQAESAVYKGAFKNSQNLLTKSA